MSFVNRWNKTPNVGGMTLRAKLLTTVLSLVFLALIFSDIASAAALRTYLLNELDNDLVDGRAAAARRIEMSSTTSTTTTPSTTATTQPNSTTSTTTQHRTFPRENDQQLLNDFFVQVRNADGTVDDQLAPAVINNNDPLPDLPQSIVDKNRDKGPFTVSAVGNHSFHYRVVAMTTPDNRTIIVAVSMSNLYNAMNRLIWAEVIVTVSVLIGLGFAGWWIVRAELKPLEAMTETAGSIAAGDLSQRVDATNPHTEVGRLGGALNTMLTQIETSFEQQQASEDRLRRFAADASHELRTPLTAIRGYAELYRQGAIRDDEHLKRVLHRIEKEATRMGMIVEDLLLLARMDQNRPFEHEDLDLVTVINEVVHDARAIDSNHTIATDFSTDSILLSGDAARLHQVVANLVGNAISHTPDGTAITVKTAVLDDVAEVRVIDNGPGMDPEQAQRVFERFYRVDTGRSRDMGGTGLGLSIVKSIVEKHGGSVNVESQIGEGATFIVRLPLTSSRP
jgi:two-component system, OmpR family, sensor kinase